MEKILGYDKDKLYMVHLTKVEQTLAGLMI